MLIRGGKLCQRSSLHGKRVVNYSSNVVKCFRSSINVAFSCRTLSCVCLQPYNTCIESVRTLKPNIRWPGCLVSGHLHRPEQQLKRLPLRCSYLLSCHQRCVVRALGISVFLEEYQNSSSCLYINKAINIDLNTKLYYNHNVKVYYL
jgi:hypothetical protein